MFQLVPYENAVRIVQNYTDVSHYALYRLDDDRLFYVKPDQDGNNDEVVLIADNCNRIDFDRLRKKLEETSLDIETFLNSDM